MVTVDKDGYEPVQTQIVSQVAGAGAAGMAGNVLVGGIIGVGLMLPVVPRKNSSPILLS